MLLGSNDFRRQSTCRDGSAKTFARFVTVGCTTLQGTVSNTIKTHEGEVSMSASKERLAQAQKLSEEALRLHAFYKGKIQVSPKCRIGGLEDFALWYTPDVAAPCRAIQAHRQQPAVGNRQGQTGRCDRDEGYAEVFLAQDGSGRYRVKGSEATRFKLCRISNRAPL